LTVLKAFLLEAGRVVIGKEHQLKLALSCLLARGHLLLEDDPGMGKTTFAKVLARLLNLGFSRIQFTSDLLPSDITGISIFDKSEQKLVFQPGPIFRNLILGDELNRASPKTQSAFLQAMEEQSVSVDGQTYPLPQPFFLIATQNPRRSIGTFPLPESQLDRFLMKLELGYPSREDEIKILQNTETGRTLDKLAPLLEKDEILSLQQKVRAIAVSPLICEYIVDIAQESRKLAQGISPRASLALLHAAQAFAYLDDSKVIAPEHVQAIAIEVMNHRLMSGEELRPQVGIERARTILQAVPVP
jgi:MoxR-like ATPase